MINHTVKMQRDSERGIASVMTVIVMLITAFLVVSYLNVSMKELNVTERLVPNDLPKYKVEAKSENNDHALRPLLGAGLVAKEKVHISGSVSIDSFDSAFGPYDLFYNRGSQNTVGYLSKLPDSLKIEGAEIYGFVSSGGVMPTIGSEVKIYGSDKGPEIEIDYNRITTDFTGEFPLVAPPVMTSPITSLPEPKMAGRIERIVIGKSMERAPTEEYHLRDLSLSGNDFLLIAGPVVVIVDEGVKVSGNAQIKVATNGSVTFYTPKNFEISGDGIVNETEVASRMKIIGTSEIEKGQALTLSDNATLVAVAYLPNALVSFSEYANMCGAVTGHSIKATGNSSIHYDEAIREFRVGSSIELTKNERIDSTSF
jgi:hypothetical protein